MSKAALPKVKLPENYSSQGPPEAEVTPSTVLGAEIWMQFGCGSQQPSTREYGEECRHGRQPGQTVTRDRTFSAERHDRGYNKMAICPSASHHPYLTA